MKIFCWNSAILIINLMIWFSSSVRTPPPYLIVSSCGLTGFYFERKVPERKPHTKGQLSKKCNLPMLIDSSNVSSTSSCVLIVWTKARLQGPNMMSFQAGLMKLKPYDLNTAERSHPFDINLIRAGNAGSIKYKQKHRQRHAWQFAG